MGTRLYYRDLNALRREISLLLEVSCETIQPAHTFREDLGLDDVDLVTVAQRLEDELGIEVSSLPLDLLTTVGEFALAMASLEAFETERGVTAPVEKPHDRPSGFRTRVDVTENRRTNKRTAGWS